MPGTPKRSTVVTRNTLLVLFADQGIKAERLEERNDLILAFVEEANGTSLLQNFDAENGFRRVHLGGH